MHDDEAGGGGADDYYDDDEHEPCSKKIMPALFAWFVLISASSSYFTLVLPEFINLVGLNQLHLFVLVVAVHGILFLYVLVNFSIATFMDPGRLPKVDIKDVIEDEGNHQSGNYKNVLINDINVRMKWCTTCQFYRPPRSSHCGVCNACIDTMDHHCPWVCNCIARRNYKYFLQFLISLTIHMLIILGLCLTLVVFNKEDLTHIPIIISLFLIVVVGILIIPIGGLTSFHIVLVTRGRTTNEQVTGKFRTGVNPFDEGCWQNWKRVVCASTVPSYIKFRRNKQHQKDYMDNKVVINYTEANSRLQIKSSSKINTPIKPTKNINHQVVRSSEAEAAAFLNNQIIFSENGIKRVKKGSSANGIPKRGGDTNNNLKYTYTEHQIHVESGHQRKKPNQAPTKSHSGKKLAKITNNNLNHGHNGQCHITSPSRKKHLQQSVYNENFDKYDSNPIYHQQIRQQEKLLRQQERQHSQQNTIWIDRRKNRIVCHEDDDNELDNVQRVAKYQPNIHKSKHSSKTTSRPQEFKINKIMSEKRNSIQSSSTNETSSNDSNRCIRNNSYLNANHIVTQQQQHMPTVAVRPSSSTSNSSSSSKMIINNKVKGPKMTNLNSNSNRHLHQIQLEIINEKTNVSTPNMAVSMPDYASYEITV